MGSRKLPNTIIGQRVREWKRDFPKIRKFVRLNIRREPVLWKVDKPPHGQLSGDRSFDAAYSVEKYKK